MSHEAIAGGQSISLSKVKIPGVTGLEVTVRMENQTGLSKQEEDSKDGFAVSYGFIQVFHQASV